MPIPAQQAAFLKGCDGNERAIDGKFALGEVDDAGDVVDCDESQRDQRVNTAHSNAGEQELDDLGLKTHSLVGWVLGIRYSILVSCEQYPISSIQYPICSE